MFVIFQENWLSPPPPLIRRKQNQNFFFLRHFKAIILFTIVMILGRVRSFQLLTIPRRVTTYTSIQHSSVTGNLRRRSSSSYYYYYYSMTKIRNDKIHGKTTMTLRDFRLLSTKVVGDSHDDLSLDTSSSSNLNSPNSNKKKSKRITFITDIEGDKNYFIRYVENSKILEWEPFDAAAAADAVSDNIEKNDENDSSTTTIDFPYSHHVVFKNDDDILVCGGDVWDKGGNDLYVLRQLLSLERRYGAHRVYFILGNRDLNKIRILQEIGIHPNIPLPKFDGIFFLPGVEPPQDNAAERLKWILKNTMGSPNAFEHRRSELQQEQQLKQQQQQFSEEIIVTDDDVVQSYRLSCHPIHGEMGQYIQKGKFALQLEEIMFCHGALPLTREYIIQQNNNNHNNVANADSTAQSNNTPIDLFSFYSHAMPWINPNHSKDKLNSENDGGNHDVKVHSSSDWIDAMNEFKQKQIQTWINHISEMEQQQQQQEELALLNEDQPYKVIQKPDEEEYDAWSTHGNYEWESKNKKRSFGSLLQYGMGFLPSDVKNPTVVYETWMQNGMPLPFLSSENNNYEHIHHHHHESDGDEDERSINTFCRHFMDTFFEENNLRLILTGHQPIGDIPIPIKVPRTTSSINNNDQKDSISDRYIICCDTSYSGDTQWIHGRVKNQDDKIDDQNNEKSKMNEITSESQITLNKGKTLSFRGEVTVCEVLIEQCLENNHIDSVVFHGVLSDGTKYETVNLMDKEDSDIQSIVGRLVHKADTDIDFMKSTKCKQHGTDTEEEEKEEERDWWVRGKLLNGDFLVSSGKGYSVYNSIGHKKQ